MIQPTAFREVNALLDELVTGVQAILKDNFVGMYLYGSLALGDFHTERSDIDFCVVTEHAVTPDEFAALQGMHERISANGSRWAVEIEGAYLPSDAIRSHRANSSFPHIDRGIGERLIIRRFDSDWVIQRYSLREFGIVLAGPPPATLIDPISADALRAAVREVLYGWWEPMIEHADDTHLDQPGYRMYAILSMGRILYTLESGTIVSKPVAARWAQDKYGEPWAALIERALAFPHDDQSGNLEQTRDWIRFTVDHSRAMETQDPTSFVRPPNLL